MRIGSDNLLYQAGDWLIVKSYPQFVAAIEKYGLPELVSFDHDLADGHYHENMQSGILNYSGESFNNDYNKTGYHCAQWLINYCMDQGKPLPDFFVHSMNPVGTENILSLLRNYRESEEGKK
jgi:hypothetical protein